MSHLIILPILLPLLTGLLLLLVPESRRMLGHVLSLISTGLLTLVTLQLLFTANTGFFAGNDLFIDSSYTADTVKVKAALKKDPAIWKEVTIHIRKRPFTEPLKTNEEILEEMKKKRRK